MRKVIARKYTYSPMLIAFLTLFVVLIFVGFGIYFTYRTRQTYLMQLEDYKLEVWMYQQGFTSYMPKEPVEPIEKYVWTNIGWSFVGLVLGGILVGAFVHDNQGPEEVIKYDEKTNQLIVYQGIEPHNIPVGSIKSVNSNIRAGGVFTGRFFLPILHRTNQIVVKYIDEDGRTRRVTSNGVRDVDIVINNINALKRKQKENKEE